MKYKMDKKAKCTPKFLGRNIRLFCCNLDVKKRERRRKVVAREREIKKNTQQPSAIQP